MSTFSGLEAASVAFPGTEASADVIKLRTLNGEISLYHPGGPMRPRGCFQVKEARAGDIA